jgi:hypothetical protein
LFLFCAIHFFICGLPINSVAGVVEAHWLQEAGLQALSEKVELGKPITDADLRAETVGFTPLQVMAVKQRVDTLNE